METLADLFQSLADATRLRILTLLLSGEELCVCELMAVLQLPQSTVSRHLAQLKKTGWLRDRRAGVWSYYQLAQPLPPLQQSLLPILGHFAGSGKAATSDRERLVAFRQSRACAVSPASPPEIHPQERVKEIS